MLKPVKVEIYFSNFQLSSHATTIAKSIGFGKVMEDENEIIWFAFINYRDNFLLRLTLLKF